MYTLHKYREPLGTEFGGFDLEGREAYRNQSPDLKIPRVCARLMVGLVFERYEYTRFRNLFLEGPSAHA